MESATRHSTSEEMTLTFGDLCRAIASGRLTLARCGSDYEAPLADLRRWRRQELTARRLIATLDDGATERV